MVAKINYFRSKHKILLSSILAFLSLGFLLAGGILTLNSGNRIFWQTAAQTTLAGFNIYRAENDEGPFELMNDVIIPVQGDRITGFRYEFLDGDVSSGKIYYYWIDVLRLDGTSEKLPSLEIRTPMSGIIFLALGCFSAMCYVMSRAFFGRKSGLNKDGGV